MRRLIGSRLIWIYTVCHSVWDFWLMSLFTTMDVSKIKDWRIHWRNLGVKGLNCIRYFCLLERFQTTCQNHACQMTGVFWRMRSPVYQMKIEDFRKFWTTWILLLRMEGKMLQSQTGTYQKYFQYQTRSLQNASIMFSENPLIFTQVIVRKRWYGERSTSDGRTDGRIFGRQMWNHNTPPLSCGWI